MNYHNEIRRQAEIDAIATQRPTMPPYPHFRTRRIDGVLVTAAAQRREWRKQWRRENLAPVVEVVRRGTNNLGSTAHVSSAFEWIAW